MGSANKFELGDYVVCPGHGVGQIMNLEQRGPEDNPIAFFVIKIVANGMIVRIPMQSEDGLRDLVTENEVQEVFELLKHHDVELDMSTWNRRHREYSNKIKTGSLLEIADVLRSLFLLKHTKNLSFSERKLLEQCKSLIVKEVSLAKGEDEKIVSTKIDNCFSL